MAFDYAVVLTGGIACGKSAAVRELSRYGFVFIDADKIAHQVLDAQKDTVATLFGQKVISCGKVDRKALGKIVFSDSEKRRELEALLHPLIYEEIERQAVALDRMGKPYLVDIPLFFEGERYPIEKSIVVYATQEQQLERLMERDGYSEEEAQKRITSQMDIEEKRRRATYLLDNSGDMQQLRDECRRVADEIAGEFE